MPEFTPEAIKAAQEAMRRRYREELDNLLENSQQIYGAVKPLKDDIKNLKDSNFAHLKTIITLINKTNKLDTARLAQNKLVDQKFKKLLIFFLIALILFRLDLILPVIGSILSFYRSLYNRNFDNVVLNATFLIIGGIFTYLISYLWKKLRKLN